MKILLILSIILLTFIDAKSQITRIVTDSIFLNNLSDSDKQTMNTIPDSVQLISCSEGYRYFYTQLVYYPYLEKFGMRFFKNRQRTGQSFFIGWMYQSSFGEHSCTDFYVIEASIMNDTSLFVSGTDQRLITDHYTIVDEGRESHFKNLYDTKDALLQLVKLNKKLNDFHNKYLKWEKDYAEQERRSHIFYPIKKNSKL